MRNIKRRAIVLAAATSGLIPVISAKAANATWNANPASACGTRPTGAAGPTNVYTPVAGTDALILRHLQHHDAEQRLRRRLKFRRPHVQCGRHAPSR